MNRDELAHVLRASAAISNETSFVLVGSQAMLDPAKHNSAHITQWAQRRAQESDTP